MSTLDRTIRSWAPLQTLPEGLWKQFEGSSASNINELVKYLETAVSSGWMGVAAEISDYLQTGATPFLDANPELRMKVEIERLKRFAYMGFEAATKSAGERVLSFIQKHENALDHDDKLVWESVAVSSAAWFASNPRELDPIIERCQNIDERFGPAGALKDLCASFMIGLEGRRDALSGDIVGCKEKFKKANELCRKHSSETPLAHLIIHYAESLGIAGDWEAALKLARNFLTASWQDERKPFRSHLVLRAILLILKAPSELVSDTEVEFHAFRYRLLVYAMGMEEAENLYPLLDKIRRRTLERCKITKPDLYSMFSPGPIINRLRAFDGDSLEKFVLLYYQSKGFRVIDLAGLLPAVDLVTWDPAKPEHVIAIQVKSGGHKTERDKDLPDVNELGQAREHLAKHHSISRISEYRWHSNAKITERALGRLDEYVKFGFRNDLCKTEPRLTHELVEEIIRERNVGLLFRVFSNEFTEDENRVPSRQART